MNDRRSKAGHRSTTLPILNGYELNKASAERKGGGERWIRTTVPEGSDLQSDAFSRSAISPRAQDVDLEQLSLSVTAKPALRDQHLYLSPMRSSHRE